MQNLPGRAEIIILQTTLFLLPTTFWLRPLALSLCYTLLSFLPRLYIVLGWGKICTVTSWRKHTVDVIESGDMWHVLFIACWQLWLLKLVHVLFDGCQRRYFAMSGYRWHWQGRIIARPQGPFQYLNLLMESFQSQRYQVNISGILTT